MSKTSRHRFTERLLILAVLASVLASFNMTSAANRSAVQEPSGGADPDRLWAIVIGVSIILTPNLCSMRRPMRRHSGSFLKVHGRRHS